MFRWFIDFVDNSFIPFVDERFETMDKEKSFKEQLEEAQKKQNEELKDFIRDLNIGDPEDINIDYDIDKKRI